MVVVDFPVIAKNGIMRYKDLMNSIPDCSVWLERIPAQDTWRKPGFCFMNDTINNLCLEIGNSVLRTISGGLLFWDAALNLFLAPDNNKLALSIA